MTPSELSDLLWAQVDRVAPRICDTGIFTVCLNDECSTKTIFFRLKIISF